MPSPSPSIGLQYDAQGRPFVDMANGQRVYVSPVALGGQPPADTTGPFRTRPQWNQRAAKFETPLDWSNIGAVAVGATIAAPYAASALGSWGGAGAASEVAGIDATVGGMGAGGWGASVAAAPGVVGGVKKGLSALSGRDWLDLALFGGGTVADIWGAKMAVGASDRAAELQRQSQQDALALLTKQWEKYQADFKPYLDAGQGAVRRMSTALEGTTPPPIPPAVQRFMASEGSPYTQTQTLADWMTPGRGLVAPASSAGPTPARVPSPAPNRPMPAPTPAPTSITAQPVVLGQPPPGVSTTQPVPVGGGGTVRMQITPTMVKDVPEAFVATWEARGAKRVAA